MSRLESWLFHISNAAVALSGLLYFWMKYLLESGDPFALVNHPLQPLMLQIHILASPVLVFALGMLYYSHIIGKLRKGNGANRRSGLAALFAFFPMVLSGYALQMVTAPLAQNLILAVHLAAGGLFIATYAAHQVISLRLSGRRAAESAEGSRITHEAA